MSSNQEKEKDEVLRTLSHGRRFVEEILRENERLRYKLLHLEQEFSRLQGGGTPAVDLAEENQRLRDQLDQISSRFDTLARENEDFLERYQDVEKQNENLLNLYVSGFQLHSTLRQESVLAVIHEILLNLVGAEIFAIWMVDPASGRLDLLSCIDEEGVLPQPLPSPPGVVLEELAGGRHWIPGEGDGVPHTGSDPLLCVPLQMEGLTLGVLCIYKLLQQKKGINSLDQELLGLLAAQSAAALIGSRLFTSAGRELKPLSGTGRE